MIVLGLMGKNISYSFSEPYFTEKITKLGLKDICYKTFDLQSINDFEGLISNHAIKGLNVTIPYKETIIPFLDKLSDAAKAIKAVNVIQFHNGKLIGHNTDYLGFIESFMPKWEGRHGKNVLILGTGGSAKAVIYALNQKGFNIQCVSRNLSEHVLTYETIDAEIMKKYKIIINCTPVGTSPNIKDKPLLPYEYITTDHYLYDLIYNPEETVFLAKGKAQNATTQNGLPMLHLQADSAWEIWEKDFEEK